ncbi:MAG: hypothetical protein EOP00_01915 [Pedobacter sp.]|nr:MAG: hypothetical protein EOP00_01915 [Pedobacter sp.]
MKRLLTILFLLFSLSLSAQNLNGLVIDENTKLPIENVQVITKTSIVLTNDVGKFSLVNIALGEKISFRIIGYETIELIVKKEILGVNVNIKLHTKTIDLRAVNIRAQRNYKMDSLALRKEYASVFAYKGPKFTDMFVKVDPSYRSPFANINPNSTASILKFNALSAFSFFNKKKNTTSRMKELLLEDEGLKYVDRIFSEEKISSLTKLQGDSLQTFIRRYRPTYLMVKKMTEYEIIGYINRSYAEFLNSKP